ncbi:MAG: hypothetical protein OEV59_05555 [Deltaproteobacteria bacterium]|nr:hypothetical protein [Deltaproteobacteria bacterium]
MARELICIDCSFCGKPHRELRGKTSVEIILWILFIVPGLAYSIWRRMISGGRFCSRCGSPRVISPDSEFGRKLRGL